MGKQISFLHTQEAAANLLKKVERLNGRIIVNGYAHLPSHVEKDIILQMNSFFCQYAIIYAPQQTVESYRTDASVNAGTAIEFLNCCKGNPLSRTYEVGRLYIVKDCHGQYDPSTHALYTQLCKYIKKCYNFDSHSQVYFEPTFKQGYDSNYLYATRLGIPIHF